MSILQQLFQGLQPGIVVPYSQYNDTQYVYWKLVFRPKEYPYDIFPVAAIALYVICYFIFQSTNRRRAAQWFGTHLPVFKAQFSKQPDKITKDGPATYFSFSTGRKNILALHTIFTLLPRQDLVYSSIDFVWSLFNLDYQPTDTLILDFTLPTLPNTGNWVWAIIKKDSMEKQRKNRWDLTFTKASDNPLLPKGTILMAEAADVAECIFKLLSSTSSPARNLFTAINNTPQFRSLIITDQPTQRPLEPIPPNKKERHLHLTLDVPATKTDQSTLLLAIFDLIDLLSASAPNQTGYLNLRPETKNRLKTRRETLEAELRKDAEREQKEIEEEARRSEKKKEKDEAMSGMSGHGQRKALEKEQKRALRKAQGKMVKRG